MFDNQCLIQTSLAPVSNGRFSGIKYLANAQNKGIQLNLYGGLSKFI